jgi:hypothetical protein
LAYNALETKIGVDDATEIMLSLAVTASGITSVSELRELIKSPNMYKNEVVFNLFCMGLESGMLKLARRHLLDYSD